MISFMKSLQNFATGLFIVAVSILTVISIMGVWDFFEQDVISKSFQTLSLLAFVSIIILVASRHIENRSVDPSLPVVPEVPSPMFAAIRQLTITILVASASLLALLGVLSIWEVIADKDVLYKSLGSLAILAFGSFLILMTCLEREGKLGKDKEKKSISGGSVVGGVLLLMIVWMFSRFLFW